VSVNQLVDDGVYILGHLGLILRLVLALGLLVLLIAMLAFLALIVSVFIIIISGPIFLSILCSKELVIIFMNSMILSVVIPILRLRCQGEGQQRFGEQFSLYRGKWAPPSRAKAAM